MTAPHVVMLVSNDATTDARVRKTALAAAATGARVTVVALALDGVRRDSSLGDVTIARVPVEFLLRDAAKARAVRRRQAGLPLLRPMDPARESELRRRLAARERDLTDSGASRVHELQRQSLRGRRVAGRVGQRGSKLFWGGVDRVRSKLTANAQWRQVLPEADDYEIAFGPVLDTLQPDLVYAHDVQLLPVASRAVARARSRGRTLPWVYDAHEWVPGLSRYGTRTARVVAAWADLESDYIRGADAVVTVSDELAVALERRHSLSTTPTVVHNIPPVIEGDGSAPDIRSAAGVAPEVDLLVYSGGVTRARGVHTAVAALKELPNAHLAVVAVPSAESAAARDIGAYAAGLGLADRVHLLDPVPPQDVVSFLRTADVGLIPLRHFGSHEFALANKLFEYLHAGLPMVVSDCRAQAAFVETHGLGAVHRADDATSLASAVSSVLSRHDELAAAVRNAPVREEMTWSVQASHLQVLLAGLLDGRVTVPELDPHAGVEPAAEVDLVRAQRSTMLGIGPANSAGQAWAWAGAVRRELSGVRTEVVAVVNGVHDYPSDVPVDRDEFARGTTWALDLRERARGQWTHALIEAGRPLFGTVLGGPDSGADVTWLTASGVRVGLVFHGSEIRSPRAHAKTHEHSPFGDARDPYTAKLQAVADRNLVLASAFEGPIFVSTPDQLDYVPDATWLPVVIDLEKWTIAEPETDEAGAPPLVVHAPSNPILKGTSEIESVLAPFIEGGLIRYERASGLQPDAAAELIRRADILIDQVLLGLYGVLACEGLASGAVVLGHVGDRLRSRVPDEIPIIEATPDDLAERLEEVLEDLPELRKQAGARRAFVERWHDGRYAARVLSEFLDEVG